MAHVDFLNRNEDPVTEYFSVSPCTVAVLATNTQNSNLSFANIQEHYAEDSSIRRSLAKRRVALKEELYYTSTNQVYISKALGEFCMLRAHQTGHRGFATTFAKLRREFWWERSAEETKDFIRS